MELGFPLSRDKLNITAASLTVALSIAGLVTFGLLAGAQSASASSFSTLTCKDSSNTDVSGTSIALNTAIKCHTISTNLRANEVHFWIQSPTGNTTDTGIISYTPGTPLNFNFVANQPGDWSVHAIYYHGTDAETICLCHLHVTFFVLPESSIGAIGILGSSLAALGLFVQYSRSKSNKTSKPTS